MNELLPSDSTPHYIYGKLLVVILISSTFLHVVFDLDASLIPQPCTPLFVSLPLSTDSVYLTQRPIPSHRQESETSDDCD